MSGSTGYVLRHAAEMDRHRAAVIFDMGSGRTSGFVLNGREDLRKPLEQALAGLAGLGATENPLDSIDGTDNLDFLLAAFPTWRPTRMPRPTCRNTMPSRTRWSTSTRAN